MPIEAASFNWHRKLDGINYPPYNEFWNEHRGRFSDCFVGSFLIGIGGRTCTTFRLVRRRTSRSSDRRYSTVINIHPSRWRLPFAHRQRHAPVLIMRGEDAPNMLGECHDCTRPWFRFVYNHNPFYVISAVLVLYGLHVSFADNLDPTEGWKFTQLLMGYILHARRDERGCRPARSGLGRRKNIGPAGFLAHGSARFELRSRVSRQRLAGSPIPRRRARLLVGR